MVQNKPTPHKYSPERYKTNPPAGIKKVSMVQNSPIRGVQPVAHNTNFDSFLVVKNVLCASS
jgi:hypothetical protein